MTDTEGPAPLTRGRTMLAGAGRRGSERFPGTESVGKMRFRMEGQDGCAM